MDPENLVSEEKEDYWVKFNYGIIGDATDDTLHPFNTMVIYRTCRHFICFLKDMFLFTATSLFVW